MGSNLPPYKVGNLNSKLFLSEISKREKSLKRMLEGQKLPYAFFLSDDDDDDVNDHAIIHYLYFILTLIFSVSYPPAPVTPPSSFLQSVAAFPTGQTSSFGGAEKRKHSTAFPEGSGNVSKNAGQSFKESSSSSSSTSSSSSSSSSSSTSSLPKQPYLGSGSASGEGQSSANQQPLGPCGPPHISEGGGTGSGSATAASLSTHHSGSVFGSSHFPPGGSGSSHSSQQAVLPQYGGRKILVCTMDNCYCSGVPSVSGHRGHPPYPRSGSFPWVSAQDYPPPPGLASGGPSMQGLAVRDWIDASQTHRHADFYGLYGQPSTKHYVTS